MFIFYGTCGQLGYSVSSNLPLGNEAKENPMFKTDK